MNVFWKIRISNIPENDKEQDMDIITIGSKVLDDAILAFGKDNGLNNINRISNISPFSICHNDRGGVHNC